MAGSGSVICLGGRALRRIRLASDWILSDADDDDDGKTIPGESRSLSLLSSFTSRIAVVTPASAPTGHAVRDEEEPAPPSREVRALMTEDFPTLGYPTTPTVMLRFSC